MREVRREAGVQLTESAGAAHWECRGGCWLWIPMHQQNVKTSPGPPRGFMVTLVLLVHPDPPWSTFSVKFQKCGSEWIGVDQVDHGDHNPSWWTRSVQEHVGPRSDIFLMPPWCWDFNCWVCRRDGSCSNPLPGESAYLGVLLSSLTLCDSYSCIMRLMTHNKS